MKKRNMLLDFTSLLDVTLIVIFFFVLFSHFEGEENKARTDERIKELDMIILEEREKTIKAEELQQKLEEEINLVLEANMRNGLNVSEILCFNNNQNLKILLDMKNNGWGLRVIHNEEIIAYLDNCDNMAMELIRVLENANYVKDQTIFCDFVFDGAKGGTWKAHNTIDKVLKAIKNEYKYFYVSETDLSIGEE